MQRRKTGLTDIHVAAAAQQGSLNAAESRDNAKNTLNSKQLAGTEKLVRESQSSDAS